LIQIFQDKETKIFSGKISMDFFEEFFSKNKEKEKSKLLYK